MMTPEQRPIKVTRKGQVTLPKDFREALGVEEGDVLYASVEGERVVFSRPGIPEPGKPVGVRSYDDLLKALEEARTAWR
jgi:AbrB family looped-hinge helix DNA binding protein